MRLIDADALLAELNEKEIPWNRRINDIIMNQPTAYDVDKVIEQLEELNDNEFTYAAVMSIVRGGGTNGRD